MGYGKARLHEKITSFLNVLIDKVEKSVNI